jgi:hypothetical protein
MMVALSRSPLRKSDTDAGLPLRMIFTPRLSTSPCVNDRIPSSVRTMMVEPAVSITVPFLISVTVTGVTVVRVVMVAVPFMPGFNSRTDNGCPLTVKRKSSATVNSLVPSGSLTTSWLPSTMSTSNVFVSVELVVCCAWDTTAVEYTTAAARAIRTIACVIRSACFA